MLIHGTLDSSDAFLMNEECVAPAFFLANHGYGLHFFFKNIKIEKFF